MAELETGAVVASHYVVVSLLGVGGMGAVYRARNTQDDKLYAIKVLRRKKEDDQKLEARFGREARIASALGHPNIATVHDIVELEDGSPAIVMELLEGESLGARLARKGKLTAPSIARIARKVVSAIQAAHARGVVHRDLKPDNIFLCDDGDDGDDGDESDANVKVLDFGIAKVSVEATDPVITAAPLTDTGQILGTPQYMAPEQIFGEKDVDARADIWALGVILYQALAGVRPFDGENPGQVFKAIALEQPTPLAKHAPRAPKELALLIENRMLVHARAERLSDLDEVKRVLDKVIRDDELGAAATIHDEAQAPPPSTPGWRPSRAVVMLTGSALMLGGVAYISARPSSAVVVAPTDNPVSTVAPASASVDEPPSPPPTVSSDPNDPPATTFKAAPPPPAPKIITTRVSEDSGGPTSARPASAPVIDASVAKTNRSGPLKRDEF